MRKNVALLFVLILIGSNLLTIECVSGADKPSVPEFTLRYVDNSHDILPSYSLDPYTGKSVIVEDGYHVQNKTMELIIKNQPFTPYIDADNHSLNLYYSIQMKGHFGGSWFYLDGGYYGTDIHYIGADLDSEYTMLTYGLAGNNGTMGLRQLDISPDGQTDFKVQAFIGYNTKVSDGWTMLGEVYHYVFTGQSSDWSNTQTITIGDNSSTVTSSTSPLPSSSAPILSGSPTQNPTATPIQPISGNPVFFGLDWIEVALVVLLAVIVMLLVFVVVYLRKRAVR